MTRRREEKKIHHGGTEFAEKTCVGFGKRETEEREKEMCHRE